jgi:ankyrin repeat protein
MTELDRQLAEVVSLGDFQTVAFLVLQGANLNATGEQGETLFTRAIKECPHRDYIHKLLELGGVADAPSCAGITPLVACVYQNDFLLVRLMLQRGANPNTVVYNQDVPSTALDVLEGDYCAQETKADEMNLDAIRQVLLDYGAVRVRDLPPAVVNASQHGLTANS